VMMIKMKYIRSKLTILCIKIAKRLCVYGDCWDHLVVAEHCEREKLEW